jgi:hypothetical protein
MPIPGSSPRPLSDRSRRIAWIVAIVADAIQLAAMPLFAEGLLSPIDDALDLVVSLALFRLLGWHPALLPALVAELVPGVDLVPIWTLAVLVATHGRPRLMAEEHAHPPRDPGASRTADASHAEVAEDAPALPQPGRRAPPEG